MKPAERAIRFFVRNNLKPAQGPEEYNPASVGGDGTKLQAAY
jgi:hypothetical protein